MKVLFKHHRKYGANPKVEALKKGLSFPPGLHEVPDELKSDKFFQAHLKAGDMSLVDLESKKAAEKPAEKEDSDEPKASESSKGSRR